MVSDGRRSRVDVAHILAALGFSEPVKVVEGRGRQARLLTACTAATTGFDSHKAI